MSAKPGLSLKDIKDIISYETNYNYNLLKPRRNLSNGKFVEFILDENNSKSPIGNVRLQYETRLPSVVGEAYFWRDDLKNHTFYNAIIASKNYYKVYCAIPLIFDENTPIGKKINSGTIRPFEDSRVYRIENRVAFNEELTALNEEKFRKKIREIINISKVIDDAYNEALKQMNISQESIVKALGIEI